MNPSGTNMGTGGAGGFGGFTGGYYDRFGVYHWGFNPAVMTANQQNPQAVRGALASIRAEQDRLLDMLGVPRLNEAGMFMTPIIRNTQTDPAAALLPPALTLRDLIAPIPRPAFIFSENLRQQNFLFGGEHDEMRRALEQSFEFSDGAYKEVISDSGKKLLKEEEYHKPEHLTEPEECPIMQVPFEEGEKVIRLPCDHLFGADSIRHWLEKEKAECPVCRHRLNSVEVRREARVARPPTPMVAAAAVAAVTEAETDADAEAEMEATTGAPAPNTHTPPDLTEINDDELTDDDLADDDTRPMRNTATIEPEDEMSLIMGELITEMLGEARRRRNIQNIVTPQRLNIQNIVNEFGGDPDDVSTHIEIQRMILESLNQRNTPHDE
jgi:hypothetical protein